MICLVAFVIFGILGIFSAKYRGLAKEAFNCVFRRITLRPCETRFDQKIKSKVTTKLIGFPRLAKLWYKHFELISWFFVLLLFTSLFFSVRAGYNLVRYGTCEPHSTSCIFNFGSLSCSSQHCAEQGCECENLGCEEPNFVACEGDCSCNESVCG